MKTETELNADILKITTVIQNQFPELCRFLNEMPITIPVDNSPEINVKILHQYYNSLLELVTNYNNANNNKL